MFNEAPHFSCQPPVATDKGHMSSPIEADNSGSVQGNAIRDVNANLNSFKRAGCEGAAKAMKRLCDCCEVACAVVSGVVRDSGDGMLCHCERRSLVATSVPLLGKIVDGGLSRTRGAEFVMPALWEGRSELCTAIRHGAGKSAELMARGGAYTLYPNYDLLVFGLEVAS